MPGDREVSSDFKGSNDAYSDTQALKVTYGLSDALRLTSITSRKVYNDKSKGDWDFSPASTHPHRKGWKVRQGFPGGEGWTMPRAR